MSEPNTITFYEWECPECCESNKLEDTRLQHTGFKGVISCSHCSRSFKLEGLYAHGFVSESNA